MMSPATPASTGAEAVAPTLAAQAASAAQRPGLRLASICLDTVAINVVFFLALRALLFRPIGLATSLEGVGWVSALVVLLVASEALQPPGAPRAWRPIAYLAIAAVLLHFITHQAATVTPKGEDWSWIRVEMIKTPWWLYMFVKQCPTFSAGALCAFLLLEWGVIRAPRSLVVRLAPGLVAVVYAVAVGHIFLALPDWHPNHKYDGYTVLCSLPALVFSIFHGAGAFRAASRSFPLVFYTALVVLSYLGYLPAQSLSPAFREAVHPAQAGKPDRFGVLRLAPPAGIEPDASYSFLRRMVGGRDRLFVSFGPTCGIYSVRRDGGETREVTVPGLIRDMSWSEDGRTLWAANWMNGDIIAFDPTTLSEECSEDIFHEDLKTPFSFLRGSRSGRWYVANVTPPIVAALSVSRTGKQCHVTIDHKLDFHATGYTPFTDGVYALYEDSSRHRLYITVAMLEGRYQVAFLELDPETLQVSRELRLRAGTAIVPVHGRDTVLLPSYYEDNVYEVSLRSMSIVRTLRGVAPTITSMAQDEKRGYFYATSRTSGELLVIDYAKGEVIQRFFAGGRPDALWLDSDTDELFLGSSAGIFRIQLAPFLASR